MATDPKLVLLTHWDDYKLQLNEPLRWNNAFAERFAGGTFETVWDFREFGNQSWWKSGEAADITLKDLPIGLPPIWDEVCLLPVPEDCIHRDDRE